MPNALPKRVWPRFIVDALLLLALVATAWRYLPPREDPPDKDDAPDWIDAGDFMQVPSVDWGRASRHLVFAVRRTCPACQEAIEQYRRLTREAKSQEPAWLVTFISSDRNEDLVGWLEENQVAADEVIGGIDMRKAGFRATPTVLTATHRGAVADLIVGSMSGDDEARLVSRLRGQELGTFVRNQYAKSIDRDLAKRLVAGGATLIIVAGRASGVSVPAGAVHMPSDEIADRAAVELDLSKLIVVDCTGPRLGRCEIAGERLLAAGAVSVYLVPGPRRS